MIPQKNDKKRIDNGIEHPFSVLTVAFVLFVGVADVVERFRIAVCGKEQERMRLGIVQRPHEKIGQNIIFRERAEKCGFKRTDPQNDIEDHAVIRKRTDSVRRIRRDDADVAGFHLDFLFQNVVGAASPPSRRRLPEMHVCARCTEDSGGADKFRSPDLCGKKNLRSALWRADSGVGPMWSDWLSKECPGRMRLREEDPADVRDSVHGVI